MIRNEFSKGRKKVLLKMATGSGKAVIVADIAKSTAARGKRILFLVRGRLLVDQFSRRLIQERVEHGTLLAGHWNFRSHLPILVGSIDTLLSRGMRPPSDLILIDEADLATSAGFRTFLSDYPNAFIIGVTATPEVNQSLRHIADVLVNPISTAELIKQGYLAPLRYFVPNEPDMSGVKISSSTKDYVVAQAEGAMVAGQLTGKIVDHWIRIGENRPTLLFAVNIHHSNVLMERFLEKGIPAEHIDALSGDEHRTQAFKRLQDGTTRVLCTVGIATRGVDLPFVSCLIVARPTQSRRLHIQILGRGTRICEGKVDTIVLDHAGNCHRFGFIDDECETDLDGREIRSKDDLPTKICRECFCAYRGTVCPECGVIPPEAERVPPEETDDRLEELKIEQDPVKRYFNKLLREQVSHKRKRAWVYYKLTEKFGLEAAAPFCPQWFLEAQINPFSNSKFRGIGK
jgi:superfamily II DNA or RNA helicase